MIPRYPNRDDKLFIVFIREGKRYVSKVSCPNKLIKDSEFPFALTRKSNYDSRRRLFTGYYYMIYTSQSGATEIEKSYGRLEFLKSHETASDFYWYLDYKRTYHRSPGVYNSASILPQVIKRKWIQ